MAGIYGEPEGMFTEQRGTFSEPKGMFMPDGSKQQDKAIAMADKRNLPSALDPMTPAIKSPLAPSNIGAPMQTRRGLVGADLSLSPRLSDPAFSIERLSGRLGML